MSKMNAMHVCLVISGRPSEVFYGGEEKFTGSLRNYLINQGHSVTVVGRKLFGVDVIKTNEVLLAPKTRFKQPRILHVPYLVYTLTLLATSLMFILKILEINRKSRLSILHAQDTGYGGLGGVIAAKLLRLPVIISSHGLRYNTIRNNLKGFSKAFLPLEFNIESFVSRRANLLIVVSPSQKAFFHKMGVEKEKVVAIPVGIKISKFKTTEEKRRSMRKELGIQQETLFGFFGRLSPEKNLFSLLEAFAGALKQSTTIKLIVVGTGPLEEHLKRFCKANGVLGNIIFTGARTDIDELLSAVDVFILPSFTEGCPTALLEAMSSGKAIIASNINSILDIVKNGSEAILVHPCDSEEIKQAILLLSKDIILRNMLSRFAQEKVKQYDVDQIYPQILNAYRVLSTAKNS